MAGPVEARLPPVRLRLDDPEERAFYEAYRAVPASRRAEWLRRRLLLAGESFRVVAGGGPGGPGAGIEAGAGAGVDEAEQAGRVLRGMI